MVVSQQNFPKIDGNTTTSYFASISKQRYYIIHNAEPCDSLPVRPRRVPSSVPRSSAMKPPRSSTTIAVARSFLFTISDNGAVTTIPLLTCTSVYLPPPRLRLPHLLEWGDVNILHTTYTHRWLLGHQKVSFPEPNYSGFRRVCELYLAYEANHESELNQCLCLHTLSLMTT